MRILRHPERFCEDSRPYWFLFVCFLLANVLLLYTLYAKQPERYRRISRWIMFESSDSSSAGSADNAQVAALSVPKDPSKSNWLFPGPGRKVGFGGMTLGEALSKRTRKGNTGTARDGVQVLFIDKGSVTYLSGVRQGDVIVSVNRMPTYTLDEFERVARQTDTSRGVLFDIFRKGRFYYMTIETRNAAPW